MQKSSINEAVQKACKRIAPAWPLKNIVAVNPYLGFTDTTFDEAARLFKKRGDIKLTMPLSFYIEQIKKGFIEKEDIDLVLENRDKNLDDYAGLMNELEHLPNQPEKEKSENLCFIDAYSTTSGKNWNQFMVDKVSSWASCFFDEYVAQWNGNDTSLSLFLSWKKEAEIDFSPEVMGLKNFRKTIKLLPDDYEDFTTAFLGELKLDEEEAETYLHTLLLKTIGWSSYISGLDFNNTVYSRSTERLKEFLAVLLAWEYYFFTTGSTEVKEAWYKQYSTVSSQKDFENESLEAELLLQDAYDFACQRVLAQNFKNGKTSNSNTKVQAQMVFCIDVRSEIYRRNLETVDPTIETLGFAGFFGFPINYVPLGHSEGKNQCPALIPSQVTVRETTVNNENALKRRISRHQVGKTWKKFKSGAVTSFGFVSPLGLTFLPKILSNAFSFSRPVEDRRTDGHKKWLSKGIDLDLSSISLDQKVAMAASALTSMGIKDNFAPIVLIAGHGSTSVNNPHASGLDCGACGGHSGEKNALTAQLVLNDSSVREALIEKGIGIPDETLFVACVHDTTTDVVSIINERMIPEGHLQRIESIKQSLERAGELARLERSHRLGIDSQNPEQIKDLFIDRTKDWAQVRPEWGLAGCNSFVIAPRHRTQGIDLQGKTFLHSYNWRMDSEFRILEGIMTAPMVVTSWINLQYYASSVDNQHFGAGNKTLHNVTGGIGVLEGSSGDLRIGLPLQSVHNGETLEHLPQRLSVVIEAPIEAINDILERNENIRQLCDNSWITLLQLDDSGRIRYRYKQNYAWEMFEKSRNKIENKVLETI